MLEELQVDPRGYLGARMLIAKVVPDGHRRVIDRLSGYGRAHSFDFVHHCSSVWRDDREIGGSGDGGSQEIGRGGESLPD